MIDKTPPSDQNIERAVLGAMLIDDEAVIEAMSLITADTFYKPVNSIIYTAICKMHNDCKPVDQLTLCDQLQVDGHLDFVGGESALAALMAEATTSANVAYHCGILLEKAALRKLITLAHSVEEQCTSLGSDAVTLTGGLINTAFGILSNLKTKGEKDFNSSLVEVSDELSKIIEYGDKLSGISTGYKRLDDMIDGLKNGNLIIIAGLPKLGKTSFALNIVLNITKRRIPVGFFSLEMPLKDITTRIIQIESRKDLSRVGRQKLNKDDANTLSECCNRLYGIPFKIDDSGGYNHAYLYAQMEKLKRQHYIKAVFIDHLQLIKGTSDYRGNRRMEITDITNSLKNYAKQLDLPIVLLSHLSRESEKQNRPPRLSDLKESSSIEADADTVMFIYKPPVDTITSDMAKMGKTMSDDEASHIKELLIEKNRGGPEGKIYYYWEATTTQFHVLEY